MRDEADSAALQTLLQDREAGVVSRVKEVLLACAPSPYNQLDTSTVYPNACGPDGFSEELRMLQLRCSLAGFPDSS